jgi:GTP-binding protein HflX
MRDTNFGQDEFEALLAESARAAADFDENEREEVHSEVADRHALRRVRGFSTELQDISEAEYRQLQFRTSHFGGSMD